MDKMHINRMFRREKIDEARYRIVFRATSFVTFDNSVYMHEYSLYMCNVKLSIVFKTIIAFPAIRLIQITRFRKMSYFEIFQIIN